MVNGCTIASGVADGSWLPLRKEKGENSFILHKIDQNISLRDNTHVHVNIPPTVTIVFHSLLLSLLSKSTCLAPLSHDTVFVIFSGQFSCYWVVYSEQITGFADCIAL